MKYLNKIIHGDCIEILKNIPDKSIDLIILDPPYWKVIQQKWDYQWRTEEDYLQWCLQWFSEITRVIKLSGSLYLFGYLRNLFYLYHPLINLGFNFRQQIIINKGIKAIGGRATKNYKMFPNVTESLLFFIYDSKPFIRKLLKEKQKKLGLTALEINQQLGVKSNGGGMWSLYTGENILAQIPTEEMWKKLQEILNFKMDYSEVNFTFNPQMGFTDVWRDIDFYKEKRNHSTQKPTKLIERIILASSNEGMLVLDPFMGSGTTAVVARKLKRNFIGFEIDKKYYDSSLLRLKQKTIM